MPQPFRIDPVLPVGAVKTYQIRQPRTAKTRIGTCQAAGCANHERGWVTKVPMLSEQADYIRNRSGRKFSEKVLDGFSEFTFYPGQQCFAQHHVADRPQLFSVRDGDFRGNPSGRQRMHTNGQYWVEDFAEHQDQLANRLERG